MPRTRMTTAYPSSDSQSSQANAREQHVGSDVVLNEFCETANL